MNKQKLKFASIKQESKLNRFYRMNEDIILFISLITIPILVITLLITSII